MQGLRSPFFWLLVFGAALAAAPELDAQRPSRRAREFPRYGFEFKPLQDWIDVPVQQREQARGIIAQMDAERGPYVKLEGNRRAEYKPSLLVVKITPERAVTTGAEGDGGGGLRGRVEREAAEAKTGKDIVYDYFGRGLREAEYKEVEPDVEEVKIHRDIYARHELIETFFVPGSVALDVIFDVWIFQLPDYQIVFIWDYPAEEDVRRDYERPIEKSMDSFRLIEIERTGPTVLTEDSTYEEIVAYHRAEVEQTPSWRLVETPSEEYLIKTNVEDDGQIMDVIERLEASRELYEEEFPPKEEIKHVSVVRVVATEEEFHKYGKTGGGTAGWFNPRSTELVLYFDPDNSDEFTMAVMSHEGFHQYCHFLFHESEAHRWFDEGHGDYYGAFDLKGGRLRRDKRMPGGLDRSNYVKAMVREGSTVPLAQHIRFDHPQWQSKGIDSYCQSWALIYFLRLGMDGKVSSKYWEREYADIIPNYIEHLSDGFQEAWAEVRGEQQQALEEAIEQGAPPDVIRQIERAIKNAFIGEETKNKIWNRALAESWGKIDVGEFEEKWLAWIEDEM